MAVIDTDIYIGAPVFLETSNRNWQWRVVKIEILDEKATPTFKAKWANFQDEPSSLKGFASAMRLNNDKSILVAAGLVKDSSNY